MPTFGEFETVGQPFVSSDERGEVTTIWRAQKSGAREERLYAVKCRAPRRPDSRARAPGDELEEDGRIKFIREVVEPLKRATSKGGQCLAPVYAFGTTETEAWYVTDFYALSHSISNSLKQYINGKGEATGAVLRHVVDTVVTGCRALKRWRGYSHGNLKPSNIFRAGRTEWRKAQVFLADPYPAPPVQFERLEAGDLSGVSETLRDTVEAQDLAGIGALLLQLVERRLFIRNDDYNYPVARSADWEALGKEADYWLGWCNKLLDPQLSLQNVNLEALAAEFCASGGGGFSRALEVLPGLAKGAGEKLAVVPQIARAVGGKLALVPRTARAVGGKLALVPRMARAVGGKLALVPQMAKAVGARAAKAGLVLGVLVAVGAAGFGIYKVAGIYKGRAKEHEAAVARWKSHEESAGRLLEGTNFLAAAGEYTNAVESLGAWRGKEQKLVEQSQKHAKLASDLSRGAELLAGNQPAEALPIFQGAPLATEEFPNTAGWLSQQAMLQVTNFASRANWDAAANWLRLASRSGPGIPLGQTQAWLEQNKNSRLRDERWQQLTGDRAYTDLLGIWRNSNLSDVLTNLVHAEFVGAFADDNKFNSLRQNLASKYALPANLAALTQTDRIKELQVLRTRAAGAGPDYTAWRTAVETNYGPLAPAELSADWLTAYQALTDLIEEISSATSNPMSCSTKDVAVDKTALERILAEAGRVVTQAADKSADRSTVRSAAAAVLGQWRKQEPVARGHLADFSACKTGQGYKWFTQDLRNLFQASEASRRDAALAGIWSTLPDWPANSRLEPITNKLSNFRGALNRWWATNSVDTRTFANLPAGNVLQVLARSTVQSQGSDPDYASDKTLISALTNRCLTIAELTRASEVLSREWQSVSNATEKSQGDRPWPKDVPSGFLHKVVDKDFEEGVPTNVTKVAEFTNAVAESARQVRMKLQTNYYAPPSILNTLGTEDRDAEVKALQAVARGTSRYADWVKDFSSKYRVFKIQEVVTNWNTLGFGELSDRLAALQADLKTIHPPYTPNPSVQTLIIALTEVTKEASDLESSCGQGGVKRQTVQSKGEAVVEKASTLRQNLERVKTSVGDYKRALGLWASGQYDQGLEICRNSGFKGLSDAIAQEKKLYDQTTNQLANCDFASVKLLKADVANTNGFQKLRDLASAQDTTLTDLRGLTNRADNYSTVSQRLMALTEDVRSKPCFQEIAQWSKSNNPATRLKRELDILRIRFGVDKELKIIDPQTGKPFGELPRTTVPKEYWDSYDRLNKEFQRLRLDAYRKDLDDLYKKMVRWDQ